MGMEFDHLEERGKSRKSRHTGGAVVVEESDDDESDDLSLADIDLHLKK